MQEKTIEVDVLLEFRDFLRVYFWWHFKKLWYFYLILLFASGGIIFLSIRAKTPIDMSFVTPLIVIFVLLGSVFLSAKNISKNVKGRIHYGFSENGVEIEAVDLTSNIGWSNYQEVQETDQDFLLFMRKNAFVPIPKRFFQDANQIQEFKELVREKLSDKAKLKND